MKPKTRQNGFTLLELLAAMGMMVVLAASLYASLYIGFKSKESAEAAIGPVRRAQIVMKLLQQDIEASLPPTGILAGVFQGIDAVDSRSRNSDSLLFYTSHYSPYISGAVSDIVQVELLLSPSVDTETNYLTRRTTVNLLPSTTPEYYEEILCRDVVSLNLSYYDGYDWLDNWDSVSVGDILPQAVEIILSIKRPEVNELAEYETYQVAHVFLLPCSQTGVEQESQITRPGSNGGRN